MNMFSGTPCPHVQLFCPVSPCDNKSSLSTSWSKKYNKTRVESDQPDKRFLVEKKIWSKIF